MKNKKIIAVSGKIGAGKTTFSNFLNSIFTKKGYKVRFLNFADTLKEICFLLTGYKSLTQEEKNIYLPIWKMTVGEFLQKLG